MSAHTFSNRHQSRGSVWNRVRTAFRVMNERRALARMPQHLLRDIGVSEADAGREASKPFWNLPNGR